MHLQKGGARSCEQIAGSGGALTRGSTSPSWWAHHRGEHTGLWLLNQALLQPHLPHTQSTDWAVTSRAKRGGLGLEQGFSEDVCRLEHLFCSNLGADLWKMNFLMFVELSGKRAGSVCERVSYPSFGSTSCIEVLSDTRLLRVYSGASFEQMFWRPALPSAVALSLPSLGSFSPLSLLRWAAGLDVNDYRLQLCLLQEDLWVIPGEQSCDTCQ